MMAVLPVNGMDSGRPIRMDKIMMMREEGGEYLIHYFRYLITFVCHNSQK